MIPWISGEMNQLHGRVNIAFGVKGTKGRGVMRFKTVRRGRAGKVSWTDWFEAVLGGRLANWRCSLRRWSGVWRLRMGGRYNCWMRGG